MARASNPPCAESIYRRGLRFPFPCGYNGKVERDGRWYCCLHDPERLAAAQAARDAEWQRQRAARNAAVAKAEQQRRDIDGIVRAVAHLTDVGVEEAEGMMEAALRVVAEWDAAKEQA